MRRILLSLLLLGAAAACGEQPTGPTEPAGLEMARVGDPSAVTPIPYVLGPVRTLGSTNSGYLDRAPNDPLADLGGDLVVWRYRDDGYIWFGSINQIRVSTGARTKLADFQSGGDAHISPDGRYTAWIDGTGIVLLDNTTGARKQVPANAPLAETIVINGGQLVFVDQGRSNHWSVALYDIASGTSRTAAECGAGTEYFPCQADAFDGRYVVYTARRWDDPGHPGILAYDTRTGQTLQAAPYDAGSITTAIWADGGRVVYARDVPGGYSVFVSDIATGATHVIDTAPARAMNLRISGNLVTWDDSRNDHSGSDYRDNHDVFLYDLAAKVLTPVTSSNLWESDARVNGNRVMWVAFDGKWELMMRDVMPVTLSVLQGEVKSMAGSGAIHSAGIARSLDALLTNAAAMQRRNRAQAIQRVRQFMAQVAQQSGKGIDAAAAQRLQGMALAVIARM